MLVVSLSTIVSREMCSWSPSFNKKTFGEKEIPSGLTSIIILILLPNNYRRLSINHE